MDGLRMDFRDAADPANDWWFSARASNTEPLLRLNVEAKRREVMEAKRNELLAVIRA
jgi:phosphomannomutase